MLSRLGINGKETECFPFKLGKYGDYISFTDNDEILVGCNVSKPGYYIIKEVISSKYGEKRVVVSEEVLYDYYSGISYNDLLFLIKRMGYKIAYEISYANPNLSEDSCERNFMAYNSSINTIIMSETCKSYVDKCSVSEINSVRCRIYGVDRDYVKSSYNDLYSKCIKGCNFIELGLENCRPKIIDGFHLVECLANKDYACKDLQIPYIGGLWKSSDGRCMSYTDLTKLFLSIVPDDFREWFSHN